MISNASEYAVRAMLCIADRRPGGSAGITTRRIAQASGMPTAYLAKVMQMLVRARLVRSQRGMHGGFVLTRPADAITIIDVVRAVEPSHRILECPMKNAAHAQGLCPLHRRLDAAAATLEQILGGVSLAQLLEEAQQQPLFCSSKSIQTESDTSL